jgi:hypothetical protein
MINYVNVNDNKFNVNTPKVVFLILKITNSASKYIYISEITLKIKK